MTLPRTVAEILRSHVTLEVEGIDRMYLNVVIPVLQSGGGINWFFRRMRGYSFASSAVAVASLIALRMFPHSSLQKRSTTSCRSRRRPFDDCM